MPWFWVGWQFDVTLFHTTGSNSTKASEYFLAHLYQHGYYVHAAYSRFRKNLAAAYESLGSLDAQIASGSENKPRGITSPEALNLSYVFGYGRGLDDGQMPPVGEKRALYTQLTSNISRMFLYLVREELRANPKVAPNSELSHIADSAFAAFLKAHGGGLASDAKLIEELRTLVPPSP